MLGTYSLCKRGDASLCFFYTLCVVLVSQWDPLQENFCCKYAAKIKTKLYFFIKCFGVEYIENEKYIMCKSSIIVSRIRYSMESKQN